MIAKLRLLSKQNTGFLADTKFSYYILHSAGSYIDWKRKQAKHGVAIDPTKVQIVCTLKVNAAETTSTVIVRAFMYHDEELRN